MLNGLLEHIMSNNPFFQNGFDDVYQDVETGLVHNNEPVFPSDTLGDYFYLRLPNNIRFDSANAYQLETCSNVPAKVYDIILVACVKDADPQKLLDNLLVSIGSFGGYLTFTDATLQSEVVISKELSFMSKESINRALQAKPKAMTIVSLSFTLTEISLIDKCVTNPCRTC